MEYVNWIRMEDGTGEEFALLIELEEKFNADLVERVLAHLKMLDVRQLRFIRIAYSIRLFRLVPCAQELSYYMEYLKLL